MMKVYDFREIALELTDWHWKDYSQVIFMQFTWLLDKNWKEIYEGDIVHTHTIWMPYFHIETIVFEDYSFYSKEVWMEWLSSLLPERFEYEVIWNIYENPELLTQ